MLFSANTTPPSHAPPPYPPSSNSSAAPPSPARERHASHRKHHLHALLHVCCIGNDLRSNGVLMKCQCSLTLPQDHRAGTHAPRLCCPQHIIDA